MRAALLAEHHQDFAVDTVPDPKIETPNDVIIRVGAAGFCRTDIHMRDGQFDDMQRGAGIGLPFICGHENAGWVAEVGAGVTHIKVGDPVLCHPVATCGYCHFCRAGDDMHCTNSFFPGLLAPGGFAEYMRTNARACVPLPEGLAPVDVAAQGDAGLQGVQVVIDYVGEDGAERDAVERLGPNGVDCMVGYGGTLQVKILEEGLFPEISFVSCIVGNYNELVELVDLTARGLVTLATTTFPLDGVNEAFHALDEGRMVGRGVLVPNES